MRARDRSTIARRDGRIAVRALAVSQGVRFSPCVGMVVVVGG